MAKQISIQQQFQFVRLGKPFDLLISIASEPNLNVVLAVLRKVVTNERSAARAVGKPFNLPAKRGFRAFLLERIDRYDPLQLCSRVFGPTCA